MCDIGILICGIVLILVAIICFMGKTWLVPKSFRESRFALPYLRIVGAVIAVLGIEGVILAFAGENIAVNNKPLAVTLGIIAIVGVLIWGVSKKVFQSKAMLEEYREENSGQDPTLK